MKIDANTVQRLRFCAHEACREAFTICVSCDRGQHYCSPECRSESRCGSDMTLTVATSKANGGGIPIGVVSSVIGSGRRNLP